MAFSQVIPYMTFLGFSESARSWMWTVSALIGIGAQLLVGYLSDKYQRIKRYFLISTILMLITSALGYSALGNSISLYFLLISLFVALFKISSNLIETWIIQVNHEVMSNFGLIRIFGSFGWAVGSIIVAQIIDNYGFHELPLWFTLCGLVTLLLIIGIPDSQKVSNKVNLELKDLKELLSNKQYVLSVVIFFILFIVYALDSLTVVDKMIEINSTSDQIGLRWGFQAIVEIPLMIFGFKFIQRFSAKKILGFTALIFGIRYALYGLSETANQMILISVLQAITFPFMLLTQKVLVNDYTPLHLRASGHMVMTAVTSNIPIIIVPLLNTLLHQYISYSQILLLGGILCLIPMILTFKLERVDV